MNGLVILNKESGISSNTACRKVGKLLGEKKVGHLGTLDVLASGVLPVALGKYTKLFDFFLKKQKEYIATFTFGYETATLDNEGEIINKSSNIPTKSQIQEVLNKFIGIQEQIPPKFSAKKLNGKCAYTLARQNIDFELKPKKIEIFSIELLSQESTNSYKFRIVCSSGTYIRSIARDLAYMLNSFATMTNLVRIKMGDFDIENSFSLEDIEKHKEKSILSLDKVFNTFEKIEIIDENVDKLLNGQSIMTDFKNTDDIIVLNNNEVVGIGKIFESKLKLKIQLKEHL